MIKKFRVLFLIVFIASGCDTTEAENSINTESKKNNEKIINQMVKELRGVDLWDDTQKIFSKYYYQPDSLLNGELRDYFLDDFHYLWEYVNEQEGAFDEIFKVLKDKSLKESEFELYSKNNVCDECIILLLIKDDWHLDFCIKEQKIYSTIGSFDLDKEEFIWYRTSKEPSMRFN